MLVLVMIADMAEMSILTLATVDFSGLWRYTMAFGVRDLRIELEKVS